MAGRSCAAPGSLEWLFVIPEAAASSALKNRSNFPALLPARRNGQFQNRWRKISIRVGVFFFTSLLSSVVLHREGGAEAVRERCLPSPGC